MDKYIEREAALSAQNKSMNLAECRKRLYRIPAADVVEVVRCGQCKYGLYTGIEWFCDKHSGHADRFGEDASYHEYHSKYWFCADGERKDGDGG